MRSRLNPRFPDVTRLRGIAARLTTPLLPDDYLSQINPLWSARELRGRVDKVIPETDDAATLVIRPGWGWSGAYQPGQYVGIGVDVDGRFHWRSYSLSSPPLKSKRQITITVKAMPEGFLSDHLVRGLQPGTIVRLAQPQGDFVLPDPPPPRLLFVVAGSGITPVMAMLRTLQRRGTMPDVVLVYSSPTEATMIFRDELRQLAASSANFRLHEQYTRSQGRFQLGRLAEVCSDWRTRHTWACGPEPMLDAAEAFWRQAGAGERLHLERFSVRLAGEGGEGGHVVFKRSGREADVDGATTLLEAGEKAGIPMPFGCRMGICHTCTVPLASGRVRDLRNGDEHGEQNESIQTCVSVAAGNCVLEI
ncbi:MAG: NADPH oxidoreductase [Candidatus Dormibacteria bacterium]